MEKTKSLLRSALVGSGAAVLCVLFLSAIAAVLLNKAVLGQEHTQSLGVAILLISTFAGCLLAGRIQAGKLLATCGLTVVMLIAVCLLIKAAFFGQWEEWHPLRLVIMMVAGLFAALVPTRGNRRRRKR